MKFDFLTSLTSLPQELTASEFERLTHAAETQELIDRFRAGDEKAKRRLPAVTWQASFGGKPRRDANAEPSGLFMLDIDHLEAVALDALATQAVAEAVRLGIYVVHTTPSGAGLRIVAATRPDWGVTIAEQQARLAAELGLASYDACTKDWARLSFLVPAGCFHLLRKEVFTEPPRYLLPLGAVGVNAPKNAAAAKNAQRSAALEQAAAHVEEVLQTEYRGFPLQDIALRYFDLQGSHPAVGERNARLYAAARDLRYICDFNPATLAAMLPDYGLPRLEVAALARSACESTRAARPPQVIADVLSSLAPADTDTETATTAADSLDALERTLPPLPPLLAPLIQACPPDYRASTLVSLLPVLGTLATGLQARYLDGTLHTPSFFVVVEAPQASGKSFVRGVINELLAPLRAADEEARMAEDTWKREFSRMRNAKEVPTRPEVCIRLVPASISVAMLLHRLKNAKGKHLFSFAEEIDTLTKSNQSGAWAQKSDIYRNAFDNAEYGQDYMNENSTSTLVRVFYNLLVLGTPRAVRRFFNDPENGLVSRVCRVQ